MAVANLNRLKCTPVELLYQYVINKMYGLDCNPLYTEETAYEAYTEYWAYLRAEQCGENCDLEAAIRRSNYGCSNIDICEDKTLDCNLTLTVNPTTHPCRTININVT